MRWANCEPLSIQRVYFANHSSHLDAAVMWASLPATARALTSPVAGIDYWGRTTIRRYLADRVFHAILINRPSTLRGGPAVDRRAAAEAVTEQLVAAIDAGRSLIVFPEGTRGSGDEGMLAVVRDRTANDREPSRGLSRQCRHAAEAGASRR